MNNITPIRQQVAQPDPQWGWPHPEHPIWPPEGTCGPPPCPPPCPPRPPSCFSQIAKADACWDQSQALYNLVSKVVMDIFQTNPGIIPSPPPGQGSGPIIGVTDGSDAQPGAVGEFVSATVTLPYAANTTLDTAASAMILQPGDWDLTASLSTSTNTGSGAAFYLNPVPPGVVDNIWGWYGTNGATEPLAEFQVVIGSPTRANFSVPTLLAFRVLVGVPPAAGTATLTVHARRVR